MDKILGGVKDFSDIKKYLAAINQTTDDFLYVFDFSNHQIEFFGPIYNSFNINQIEQQICTYEEFLSVVHSADRKALRADLKKALDGEKDAHDLDFRMFKNSGETVWLNSRGKVLHDDKGNPYAMIGRLSEEAVRHLFNPVTGLWNKTKLHDDLQNKLKKNKGWLMKLRIPSFVDINLMHGREFGNELLCEMAELLEEIEGVEESYHTDSNDFALILHECEAEKVEEIYQNIYNGMREKCSVFGGVAPIDNRIFIDVAQIMDAANITLQTAAQNASTNVGFFSVEEIDKRIKDITLFEEMKESVQNDFEGFEIYYQPQIKSGSYELYGVEALLRYNSKKHGRVFPDEFIPILERSGLIESVGMWVLSTALLQCKEWRKSLPALQVSVNFSSIQFENPGLGEKIVGALKEVGLPGSALTVELTESVQLNARAQYSELVKYVKPYGVRLSIDDFGTGYSNLVYLKQLDVNEIKIDRSFVTDIEKNTYNYRLISNVIEFAKINSIHACCEGVETAKELLVLEPLQADFFQGYLFDKPCSVEEITQKYIDSSSEPYKLRTTVIEEICRFKEEFGSIHFNPIKILSENNIGLWIMRIDEKKNRYELYADSVMERVLGVEQKLSPKECYNHWHSRISPEHVEYVDNAIDSMIVVGKAVQLEYDWIHPMVGKVHVRSSGIRTLDDGDRINLEGYHRILTGVEGV